MKRTIVVGIGNPILGDDAVGIHVARALVEANKDPGVVIEEAFTGGLNLLDLVLGYDRVILVDSISIPERDIGEVFVLDPMKVGSSHSANPHDLSFPEAIELAKNMGAEGIPEEIVLIAINIRPSLDIGEGLDPKVENAIPLALERVDEILGL
ncbi:MAG: hydrogenase maturation protease [Candidatus Thermoplasmatota archaeon]|nr:hydrogenase maturation protease [Candidatus Thermoplasmatota archaeon]